jgi:hypothetical protein
MILDNEDDSEDWQKFKNFMIFKFWGTNKERDEAFNSNGFMILGIALIIAIIIVIICYVCKVF